MRRKRQLPRSNDWLDGRPPTTGLDDRPQRYLQRPNLANATSHWVANGCRIQVEITADMGFWSIVLDSAGTTSSDGELQWTLGPNDTSVLAGPVAGLGFQVSGTL